MISFPLAALKSLFREIQAALLHMFGRGEEGEEEKYKKET